MNSNTQNDKSEVLTKHTRKRLKRASCFGLFFVILFLLCGGIIALLAAGGWVKNAACSVVTDDSYIFDKFNCQVSEDMDSLQGDDQVIDIQIPEGTQTTEQVVTKIIEEVSPAVVTVAINSLQYDFEKGYVDTQSGIGSGFIVDSDGLIITNQHVVSDENGEYSVILPDEEKAIPVEKIYRDKTNDIAVLKINHGGLKALKLGDSEDLKRGNLVVAIGSPGNPSGGVLEGTASVGYITGLHREVTAGSDFLGSVTYYEDVIQTDAAINPGNSGGPLLNSSGEVIGVNFGKTYGADNIGFAIPINQVKNRLEVFEKEGRFPQPYIGVSYNQRTVLLKDGILTGAVIFEVETNGPADEAGIQKGDIILEVDGKSLAEYSLEGIIQDTEVGGELKMLVWREGKEKTVKVTVGDKGE
ncbi:MAG: trypsin-like peptidase domain-containing protein [Candidatus Dojkabacteria bacterium]|nr:trypsin-like peptidase domain-containing protein [Candidatus Dojkabacteria bacterium]